MKTYKLIFSGAIDNFNVEYNYSTNFGYNYSICNYEGTEQERFEKFYKDYKTDGASPLNIKLLIKGKKFDRGLMKNEVLKFTEVKDLVDKLTS